MTGAGKVLLLGATGFFGGWIAREFDVVPAARDRGGDLLDPDCLRRLIAEVRPAAVVNAAGMTSPAVAQSDPAGCFELNTGGVMNLLEAVRLESPETRVITLSSAAVYAGDPPFDEGSPTAAITPYAASKLAMEILCGQYSRGYGIGITVLRCFNLIGPGEPGTQASSEFCRAAIAAGAGGTATVEVGDPATARDFIDVRDAARAVRLVIENRAEGTLNLCSGASTSLQQLADSVGRLAECDLKLLPSGTGRPKSGIPNIQGDPARLERTTGWRPEIPLDQSLSDLIAGLRT